MSFDITTLVLGVDSTQVRKGRSDLESFSAAGDRAAGSATRMESSVGRLGAVLRAAALGAGVVAIVKMADAMTLADARLRLATGSAADFAKAQEAVYAISQKTSSGLLENVALFTKLHDPVKRLGGGVRETSAIVESFAASLKVGGASTQEAAAATLQFAQAMGSGKLQGDEFRSIAEASPRFMKALADGMDVPIEKLKKMGGEGKLTADVVGNALVKSLGQLRSELGSIPDTASGSITRFLNDFKLMVNEVNKSTGFTLGIAGMVDVARQLLPTIKTELVGAFTDVHDWIERNREGIADVWEVIKAATKDAWDLARAAAGFVGFVVEAAVQSGTLLKAWELVRVGVAGVRDGVEIIGAFAARVGAAFLQQIVVPMTRAVDLAGTLVGVFDSEKGESIHKFAANVRDVANATAESGEAYAQSIFAKFADGKTATQAAVDAIEKARLSSAQLKDALASGSVSAADNSREMSKFARQAESAAGALVTLKNKHVELTDEQKKALKVWTDLKQSIDEHIKDTALQIQYGRELTEAEKFEIKYKEELGDKYKTLTLKQREYVMMKLAEWKANLQVIEAAKLEAQIQEEVHRDRLKAWDDAEKIRESYKQLVEQQQAENDQLRYTKEELVKVEMARLNDAIAVAKQKVALDDLQGALTGEAQANRETLDGLLALKSAREQNISLAAARQVADAWRELGANIYDWLAGAMERAWGAGGEGIRGFLKDVREQLKRAALSMTVKLILDQSGAGLQALIGLLGGAMGSGGSGGMSASSLISGVSTLGNMTSGSGGLAGNVASGALQAGNYASVYSGSAYGTAFGSQQSAMLAAQESGMVSSAGASSMLSYAGYAALIAAAVMVAEKLYSKGYTGSDRIAAGGGATNTLYQGSVEGITTRGLRALGLSDKWAEILGGSVRMNWTLDQLGLLKTPHTGGYAMADAGGVQDITKLQGGIQNETAQKAVESFATDMLALIQNTAKTFGGKSNVTSLKSVFESDNKDGSWGLFQLFDAAGQMVAKRDSLGTLDKDPNKGFQQYTDSAAGAIVDALKQADLPKWVTDQLSALGDAVTIADLGKKIAELKAYNEGLDALTKNLGPLAEALTNLSGASSDVRNAVVQSAGGLDAFQAQMASFTANYTTSAQQQQAVTDSLTAAFDALGVKMPDTRQGFLDLVSAQDLTTESGLAAWNGLMALQATFAAMTPSMDDLARAADEARAATEAHARAVMDERYGLETQLLQLQGNTAALRAREREKLDESNRALYDQIKALEDQQGAMRAATSSYASVGDAASSAASSVQSSMSNAFSSIIDEINRLRGVVSESGGGSQSLDRLQAAFAIDTAAARAGDTSALGRLTGLSRQIDETAKTRVRSREEQDFIRASIAASLEATLRGNGGTLAGLITEVKQMRSDVVAQAKATADSSNQAARTLRRATTGNALRTTT